MRGIGATAPAHLADRTRYASTHAHISLDKRQEKLRDKKKKSFWKENWPPALGPVSTSHRIVFFFFFQSRRVRPQPQEARCGPRWCSAHSKHTRCGLFQHTLLQPKEEGGGAATNERSRPQSAVSGGGGRPQRHDSSFPSTKHTTLDAKTVLAERSSQCCPAPRRPNCSVSSTQKPQRRSWRQLRRPHSPSCP